MKVVIADDSSLFRDKIKDLLNDLNNVEIVGEAVNGLEALKLIEDILETPPTLTEIGKKYLKGVTKEHIVVLEAERILNDKKIIVNEEVI